ncbi:TM2 domain-containing protein [Hymenobacter cheonanensis]|uniref:TM2 domain-containing protein n=1 Tax=Hymenobacter sp. CA2-7 TaxID=3063993 RepID=UPI002713B3C9|nr:TM2 domain-containing protein [Hymenobacter sp. CA2-7]MDO7885398.1 TM2 domain-containing protein [Hymenobacter sp. CA2-7]
MPFRAACCCHWLFLLTLVALGACQRASYSFQASSAGWPPLPTATAPDAGVAPARLRDTPLPLAAWQRTRPLRQNKKAAAVRKQAKSLTKLQQWLPTLLKQPAVAYAKAQDVSKQQPGPADTTPHRRTKGIALLLALFVGGIGGHLFYLGYYGRGTAYLAATAAGFLLLVVAVIGSIATLYGGGAGFMGLAIAGVILSSVVSLLSLIDMVRIITGDLKPRNGEYFPRFFQTRDTP